MCGIAGILKVWAPAERDLALRTPHAQSIPEAWLDILDDSIKHRGPDGHGRFRDRALRADGCVVDVALVHRRLSIIDHAGGHQPMVLEFPKRAPSASSGSSPPIPGRLLSVEELQSHNRRIIAEAHHSSGASNPELALGAPSADSQDRIAIVFNGCIYNHRALRAELQSAGHVFTTDHSDTEVLVHGWREWGEGVFEHLHGMFAAAIWDADAGSLAIVRDPFGEKPLHLHHVKTPGAWVNVFGSVPPAATRLPAILGPSESPIVPTSHAWNWLRFGHALGIPLEGARETSFSQAIVYSQDESAPSTDAPPPHGICFGPIGKKTAYTLPRRTEDWTPDQAEERLSAGVLAQLEADVPIGCFLSGGVDSSLIALFAKRHAGNVNTFTVRMPFAAYDESEHAQRVASIVGSKHTTLDCHARPAEDLQRLIQQSGVPLGDSSLLPAHWVSRAARQYVKVALGGDGADELFGGYERYASARWMVTGMSGASVIARALATAASPKSRRSKLARFFDAAAHAGYLDIISIFPTSLLNPLLKGGPDDVEHRRWLKSARMPFNEAQAIAYDLMSYLPNDILRKTDTASMASALEVRSPYIDQGVVRSAMRAKLGCLLPGGQRKGLLRAVARKYLPPEIVDRPKMGFAIPIGEWFRSDYGGLRTMLLDHLNSTEPFGPPSLGIDLNMAFIRQMLDEHLGTGPSGLVKRDHSQRLYMLLVLSIWSKWIGGLR